MSFDVDLVVDTGGEEPVAVTENLNITYNVSPMFLEAMGGSLRDLDGVTGEGCKQYLRRGIARMEDEPDVFSAMNPENGWGNSEGALAFLRILLRDCVAHPKAKVRIS